MRPKLFRTAEASSVAFVRRRVPLASLRYSQLPLGNASQPLISPPVLTWTPGLLGESRVACMLLGAGMRPKRLGHTSLAVLGVFLAIGLSIWTFRNAEASAVASVLRHVPLSLLLLILVPQLLSLTLDSWGWVEAIRSMGHRVPVLRILLVRIKTEALSQTLPLGPLWCESATPLLLKREGVPWGTGVAAVAVRKYLLILSQAWFLIFSFVIGHQALGSASQHLIGSPVLMWLPLAAAVLLGSSVYFAGSLLGQGAVATQLWKRLLGVPSRRLRAALASSRTHFSGTDRGLTRFFSQRVTLRQVGPYLGSWLCESLETLLILRLLSVQLGFVDVVSFEVLLALTRNLAFMVPAGLGIQDLGYVTFFGALGIPEPVQVGAAFSILKRSKELIWACVGYACLARKPPLLALEPTLASVN